MLSIRCCIDNRCFQRRCGYWPKGDRVSGLVRAKVAFAVLFVAGQSALAASYDIVDLGTALGGTASAGYSINNKGQVTGTVYRNGFYGGYVYDNGSVSYIGNERNGSAISESGVVAGRLTNTFTRTGGVSSGMLYINGSVSPMNTAEGGTGIFSLTEFNAGGRLAGTARFSTSDNRAGIVTVTASGGYEWTIFSSGLGDSRNRGFAYGINDGDVVVGRSYDAGGSQLAAKWTPDGNGNWNASSLGVLPGGTTSIAYDINNSNVTVGSSTSSISASIHNAALWRADNTVVDLDSPGGYSTFAYAINDSGVVVGSSNTTSLSGSERAYVWIPDEYGEYSGIDLNSLIDPSLGWELKVAFDVNESGQIVGYGIRGGRTSGFILNPIAIPEPSAMAVVLPTLAVMGRRRR